MNLTHSHTIIPLADHPSRDDRTAKLTWSGHERDHTRRHLPAAYSVTGGYLLAWSEPGTPFRSTSVLELFATEAEAISAWQIISREAL